MPENQPKTEIKPEEKPKKRSCCNCLNCFIILLVIFLIIILVPASLVSATGLVKIPVLSSIFYKEPKIEKEYKILTQEELLKKFEEELPKPEKGKKAPEVIEIELTEDDLTSLILSSSNELKKKNSQVALVEKAQVLVKTEEIDALLLINFSGATGYPRFFEDKIWLNMVTGLKGEAGKISLDIKKAKIGSLGMPISAAKWLISMFNIAGQGLSLPAEGLKNLTISQGKIKITADRQALEEALKEKE